ncbi:MAG: hypothetical protein WCS65_04185 [Verrucomicrobiae bacterium]
MKAATAHDIPDATANDAARFRSLFLSGVLGWVAGTILLFAAAWPLTKPETFSEALMWSVAHWWIAFAFGFVVLVVRGALGKGFPGAAAAAYLLPVVVIAGATGICLAIYPNAGFWEEILGCLPVVLVFYVFGFLWMLVRKEERQQFARGVLPPIIGGLMILTFVAVPVFTSNAFLYRDAFGFTVLKTTQRDGKIVAEAVLDIRKPGNYQFAAPQFGFYELGNGPDFNPEKAKGEISWGAAGEPKEGKTGTFPVQIRWERSAVPASMPAMPEFNNTAILEVRDAKKPDVLVYTVSALLPDETKK